MSDAMTPHNGESGIEEVLGNLRPAASKANRDELMFEAGRASTRRTTRTWQTLCGVFALCFAASLASRHGLTPPVAPEELVVERTATPQRREEIVANVGARTAGHAHEASYGRLRDAVLTGNLDALPEPAPGEEPVRLPAGWKARPGALSSS